jgi:hypothetical protein
MKTLHTLLFGSILGATMLFAPQASAADVGISVGIGPRPEPVIVDGGYYDYTWVEPVYRTDYINGSPHVVIVTRGYYRPIYHVGRYYAPRGGIYFNGSFGGHSHHYHHDRHDSHSHRGRYR